MAAKHNRSFSLDSGSVADRERRTILAEPQAEKQSDAPKKTSRAKALILIIAWMTFSNATIIFNKHILDTLDFHYPTTLTTLHLTIFVLATQALARFTSLLSSRHAVRMTGRTYLRCIVPIGLLYGGSLVCSNSAYLTLGVGFIQMLKSLGPAAVLISSVSLGLKTLAWPLVANVALIVFGVIITAVGEMRFVWSGFMWQMGGFFFEAYRLGLVDKLLNDMREGDGLGKIDPLVSLYYYAPVCAAMTGTMALLIEVPVMQSSDWKNVGLGVLVSSGFVAFAQNVASVMVIGATSSLTLTVCGVVKNVLLVFGSILIWHTVITPLQLLGYTIATIGLLYYSLDKDIIHKFMLQHLTGSNYGHSRLRSSSVAAERDSLARGMARRKTAIILIGTAALIGGAAGFWTGYSDNWVEQLPENMSFEQVQAKTAHFQDELRAYWYSISRLGNWEGKAKSS